jgi:hypothetical protein
MPESLHPTGYALVVREREANQDGLVGLLQTFPGVRMTATLVGLGVKAVPRMPNQLDSPDYRSGPRALQRLRRCSKIAGTMANWAATGITGTQP